MADLALSWALEAIQRAVRDGRRARRVCVVPSHNHETYHLADGTVVGEPVAAYCWECGRAMHWDIVQKDYFHNDPDAVPCRWAGVNYESPCVGGSGD